jgi:hypothetical protein
VARTGWDRLVQQHEMLKGANHRIVQGQADIGTVYRLQLITGAGGGSALCEKLKAEGFPVRSSIEVKGKAGGVTPRTPGMSPDEASVRHDPSAIEAPQALDLKVQCGQFIPAARRP